MFDGDAWVADLDFNDESVSLLMERLARELDEFVALESVLHADVEEPLGFVLDIPEGNIRDPLDVRKVVASGTPGFALHIGFSPEGYRRLAEAAKNCMRPAIDIDLNRL